MTDIPTRVADALDDVQVLRRVPLRALLGELTRRQRGRPFTGIPQRVAETLVDMYVPEEVANAVLLVARLADVAVTWNDRQSFERTLGARFTEEQWKRFAEQIHGFDEWDSIVDDGRVRDFAERCLDLAGLQLDQHDTNDGTDMVITDKEPRP